MFIAEYVISDVVFNLQQPVKLDPTKQVTTVNDNLVYGSHYDLDYLSSVKDASFASISDCSFFWTPKAAIELIFCEDSTRRL